MAAAAMSLLPAQEGNPELEKSKFPKNGVRFVICSATDQQVPSPLYVRVGNEYEKVIITSRMPTPRIAPEGGVVRFYENPPAPKAAHGKENEEPYISIAVPKNVSHKSICIVQPSKKGDTNPQTFFLSETEFKKGGVHVINFTSKPLNMIVDPTGEFSGQEKKETIAPRIKDKNTLSITDANVWTYSGKHKEAENVDFILQAAPSARGGEGVRIRAGVFMTIPDVTQINFVVKHPTLPNAYRLLSVQCSDAAEHIQQGEKH